VEVIEVINFLAWWERFADRHGSHAGMVHRRAWGNLVVR
jgi:hypothetical protein